MQASTMFLKTITSILLILTVSDSGKRLGARELRDNSQNYIFGKTSKTQHPETKEPFSYLLKDNTMHAHKLTDSLHQKLVPITEELHEKMTTDTEKLQQLVRHELQELSRKIDPFNDGAHQRLSRRLTEFYRMLTPYTEQLRIAPVIHSSRSLRRKVRAASKTEGHTMVSLTEKIQSQIEDNIAKVNQGLQPATSLVQLDKGIQKILGKLLPDVDRGSASVLHQVGTIPEHTENISTLELKINENVIKLAPYASKKTGILVGNMNDENLTHQMKDLSRNLDEVAKAFQQNTESFKINKNLTVKLKNMKDRLSPYADSLKQALQNQLSNMSEYIQDEVNTF
ncbi:apolipoprotein A-IV-like [Stegostoma tigrinum]|uniref:apolipoprotein A-IV-like n=1 Tax=Stegostoma tigrinum TaxID=3053191 RepID=UPI00202B998A|nr:apolipoprotein A-IV-like [Stegostoma tigrinum]